nr:DUF3857 domain-containing protein [Bacteroidota bacterium]
MKLKTIFITSLLLAFLFTYGQKPPSKFGKISPEEFETTVCPIDSNAHAYFIFDFGYTDFRYASTRVRENDPSSGRKGFQMFFEHHYRIKILDNNAFDLADIEIPIYHDNRDNREEITKFRAVTYNRVGKKIEGSRLRQNDLITEEASENWDVMKCAMPDVKAGSIIEVEYIVKSDFLYNMQGWEFQHTIPILHSEYLVTIPEYFYYNQSQRGYYQVNMETEAKSNSITITYHNVDNSVNNFSFNTGRSKSTRTIDFEETVYHYFAKNIPAFPIEKYLTTPKNYLSKVDFELAWIKYPGQI